MFGLARDIQVILLATIAAAIFLGWHELSNLWYYDFLEYLIFIGEVLFVTLLFVLLEVSTARLKIQQTLFVSWSYVIPFSFILLILTLLLRAGEIPWLIR